ncbi:hypothetical protein GCM10009664_37270 [Kitasatospora gansuensis]
MMTTQDLPSLAIPGLAAFARGGWPETAEPDDGNPWADGECWLYCGRWTRVLWIGPVTVAAAVTAPMPACADCMQRLSSRVWEHVLHKDTQPSVGLYRALPTATPPALGPDQGTDPHRMLPGSEPGSRRRARHRRSTLERLRHGWRRRVVERSAW